MSERRTPDHRAGGGDPAGFPFSPDMVRLIAQVAKPGLPLVAEHLRDAAHALNRAYIDVLWLAEWAVCHGQRAASLKAARDRLRAGGRMRLTDLARVRAHANMPQMMTPSAGARRKEGTDTFLTACSWAWWSLSGRWPSAGKNDARFASPGMRFIAGCAEVARLAITAEGRDPEFLRAADIQFAPLVLSQGVRDGNSRHATLRTRLARLKRPRAI